MWNDCDEPLMEPDEVPFAVHSEFSPEESVGETSG